MDRRSDRGAGRSLPRCPDRVGAYVNRTTGRVPCTEIGRVDDGELREYPETIVVVTRAENEETAFRRLFEYISGANRAGEEISLTASLTTDGERSDAGDGTGGEAIREERLMTAPVCAPTSVANGSAGDFPPCRVRSRDRPTADRPTGRTPNRLSRMMAVLGFSGYAQGRKTETKESELLETLRKEGIEPIEKLTPLHYDDLPPHLLCVTTKARSQSSPTTQRSRSSPRNSEFSAIRNRLTPRSEYPVRSFSRDRVRRRLPRR